MSYHIKTDMYSDIIEWLRRVLREQLPGAEIVVLDTHKTSLWKVIRRRGLNDYFNSEPWQSYDFAVDITAFVRAAQTCGLVLVECKLRPLSVADFSQLFGYSRIVVPLQAYLLSPAGIGSPLRSLIETHHRSDILEYAWPRGRLAKRMILAKWDPQTKSPDAVSVLPPGSLDATSL